MANSGAAMSSSGAAEPKNSHDGFQNPQYIDSRLPSVVGLKNAVSRSIGLRTCAAKITHRPNVSA